MCKKKRGLYVCLGRCAIKVESRGGRLANGRGHGTFHVGTDCVTLCVPGGSTRLGDGLQYFTTANRAALQYGVHQLSKNIKVFFTVHYEWLC